MSKPKNWSKKLYETVEDIYSECNISWSRLERLINMALKEGRQEVLDDPRAFDLVSRDECLGEPMRDESRD
jgi:hypothetical protein